MRKSDLKSKLSELAYQVTQNADTEPPFSGNSLISSIKVFINVFVVIAIFLVQKTNFSPLLVGQAFIPQ